MLAFDYVNISIRSPIINLGVDEIISGCFDKPSFNSADPVHGTIFYSQLGLDITGQISNSPTNPAARTGFVMARPTSLAGSAAQWTVKSVCQNSEYLTRLSLGADTL